MDPIKVNPFFRRRID